MENVCKNPLNEISMEFTLTGMSEYNVPLNGTQAHEHDIYDPRT